MVSRLSGGSSIPDLAAQQGFGSLQQVLAKVRTIEANIADITQLQADVEAISLDLTTAESDITQLQTDLTTAESDITQLQTDLTTAESDIALLQTHFPSPITAVPTADQVVTSATLKALLDVIFPVGTLQMTSGAAPNSYNGYMVWTLYSAGDNRYLKCYGGGGTGGSVAGTTVAQQVLTHTHTINTIVQPAQTVTSSVNTLIEATTAYKARAGTAAGAITALGTPSATALSDVTALSFSDHTHTVTVPSQNLTATCVAAGASTNECNAIFVAVYRRTS